MPESEYTIEQVQTLDGCQLDRAVESIFFPNGAFASKWFTARDFSTDWSLLPLAFEEGGPCYLAGISQCPDKWRVSRFMGQAIASGPTLPVAVWRAACVAAIMERPAC